MSEQPDTVQRYYLDDRDAAAVRDGYAWLLQFAATNRLSGATIFMFQAQHIPRLADGLGPERATMLDRKRTLTEHGVTVAVHTSRSRGRPADPVLGVWVDDRDLLDRLDAWRVPAICAIPWGNGVVDWKARWRPVNIRTGEPAPDPGASVSNAVVAAGLETLTQLANLSNGLDSYNRDIAAQVFVALRREGESFDPDEVRSWAARHGWGASHAIELADLARKVIEGRRVRTGHSRLREDIVDQWRNEVTDARGDS